MSQEPFNLPEKNSQIIRHESELTKLPVGASPALSEIISRSLVHIQTSKTLTTRHRIGEHELCWPDYSLVCNWAEELRLTQDEVLNKLMNRTQIQQERGDGAHGKRMVIEELSIDESILNDHRIKDPTTIVDGRFKSLLLVRDTLPVTGLPPISGLTIKKFRLSKGVRYEIDTNFELNLNSLPNLTELYSRSFHLKELDLFKVPRLRKLEVACGNLDQLDLSGIAELSELYCNWNYLTKLDLSPVPHLSILDCDHNQLVEINLSHVPYLRKLICEENPIEELDIRDLEHLHSLNPFYLDDCIYSEKIRLIKRKDQ